MPFPPAVHQPAMQQILTLRLMLPPRNSTRYTIVSCLTSAIHQRYALQGDVGSFPAAVTCCQCSMTNVQAVSGESVCIWAKSQCIVPTACSGMQARPKATAAPALIAVHAATAKPKPAGPNAQQAQHQYDVSCHACPSAQLAQQSTMAHMPGSTCLLSEFKHATLCFIVNLNVFSFHYIFVMCIAHY